MRPDRGSRRDFRRDFKNKAKGNFNNQEKEKDEAPGTIHKCGICLKDIEDLSSAIALPSTGEPAHFDCVLSKVKETETLAENEQVVYLGSGSFGVIQNISDTQNPNFKIIKKIDFEKSENMPEWRKQLVKVKI